MQSTTESQVDSSLAVGTGTTNVGSEPLTETPRSKANPLDYVFPLPPPRVPRAERLTAGRSNTQIPSTEGSSLPPTPPSSIPASQGAFSFKVPVPVCTMNPGLLAGRSMPTPSPSVPQPLSSSAGSSASSKVLLSSNAFDAFLRNFLTELNFTASWFAVLASIGMTEANMRLVAGFDEARRDALIAKLVPTMSIMDRAILGDAIQRLA
ncbi:hypothetical protein C8R44DRAFT_976071 [Mycena epipterygia]|nr:hypothetical protein C8R44DRAFT_976071 [Mycena epipterygia]